MRTSIFAIFNLQIASSVGTVGVYNHTWFFRAFSITSVFRFFALGSHGKTRPRNILVNLAHCIRLFARDVWATLDQL